MRLYLCLGLSGYDMNIFFYFVSTLVLCSIVQVTLDVYNHTDLRIICLSIFYQLVSLFMYISGFSTGMILARLTMMENPETPSLSLPRLPKAFTGDFQEGKNAA